MAKTIEPIGYYPMVSFHFRVNFLGTVVIDEKKKIVFDKKNDLLFQSVTGLDVQMETETIKEGGENRFEHVVPQRTKYSDLVLKRGVLPIGSSSVSEWLQLCLGKGITKPVNLTIELLNESHEPLIVWNIAHAWPKNWKLGEMNAEKGEVFIETMELNYNYFSYTKV